MFLPHELKSSLPLCDMVCRFVLSVCLACGFLSEPSLAVSVGCLVPRLKAASTRPLLQFDYVKRRRKRRDRNRRNTIGDTRDIEEAALRTDLPR